MTREFDERGASAAPAGAGDRRLVRRCAAVLATAVLAGAAFVAGAVAPASPAAAVSAPQTGVVVSDDPANTTPHVLDGYVRAFAEVGNIVVVGGNFTQARTAASPTVVPRSYIFAFDRTTGAITPFNPTLNGEVYQILSAGDGQTVWVAGGFSSVNGQTVRSLVKLNLSTGQRVASFNPPAFGGRIQDMALRNGRLYLTGRFPTVAGQPQTLLAAVNSVTGANVPSVKLTFADPRNGGSLNIYASDVTPDGNTLIAVGNFQTVAGQTRIQIAKIDLSTGGAVLANWNTNRFGNDCNSVFDTYMRDVEFSPDGSYFVAVSTGSYSSTFLCDVAARFDTSSSSLAADPVWTNYSGGDTLTAVAVTDAAVYVGGHQRWMNNPYAADNVGAGAVEREGLAAVDPRSGALLPWNPTRTRGIGVYGFAATETGLWIGSDTDRIGAFEYHGRMALMPLATGAPRVQDFTGSLPAQTVTIASTGLSYTRRQFTGSSVTSSASVTANWAGLRGAFMLNGKLYTAWSDQTFRVQSYDGTTFGPQTTLPLALISGNGNSNSTFATQDLATLTSMFYDPVTGRIYFTKANDAVLYYRSFSQESNIVGADRQDGIGAAGGIDWRTVRGAFLVDNLLFVADPVGQLTRWTWDPKGGPADTSGLSPAAYSGRPVGAGMLVSGPTIDGQDWSGLDTFVYADAGGAANQPPVAVASHQCTNNSCQFDGSTSSDADGTIASYVWNFGDGTTPGAGPTAAHVYAAAGTYTATLTVVDDDGALDSTTFDVVVTIANQPPVATFTSGCTGLSCSFDGSASGDPDGSVVGYAWTFGDGGSATGASVTHAYGAAGTYTVSLTVTDDRGGTNATTRSVTVVDPNAAPTVSFVGAAGVSPNSATPTVVVPGAVVAGDTMVLIATSASTAITVTPPTGWTQVHTATQSTGGVQTWMYTKTATASDAGRNVVLAQSTVAKTALQLLAYRGANGIESFVQAFDTVSRAERTTPAINVATPGSMVVSYWADKSSSTTTWALPAEVTLRNRAAGTSAGRIVAAVGDTGPLAAGPGGAYTAVADSANTRGVVYSVVVGADVSTPNVPPTASFTTSCTNLTCAVDGSGSSDSDNAITDYSWNFGDGATGSGVTTSHSYGAPGTYTVTLTVTDAAGGQGSTTRQVTASNPPATVVSHRGSAGIATSGGNPRVTTPAVVAGDVLVMIVTVNGSTASVSTPAGWTLLGGTNNTTAGVQTWAWTKVATATDAGTSVGPNLSSTSKTTLQLVAYSGASGVSASAHNISTTTSATRTTPTVAVAANGSALISYWADKSSATTTWATPPGVTLRQLSVGSASGRIVSAIGDTGSVAAGTAGGVTATADSSSARGIVWSIVVAPS